ncbi:MAG: hypothetical protein JW798_02995 [Prolixibacteraceae bacterium]|nr:hypothetical protein [Prolixibacteraceae bacterium]
METIESKLIVTGSLFLIMLITGVIVKKAGKPYPFLMLSLHKIFSLLAGIAAIITVIQLYKNTSATFWIWVLMIVAVITFLLSFSSGTILTVEKKGTNEKETSEKEEPMKKMHVIAPLLTTLLTALIFYLMY